MAPLLSIIKLCAYFHPHIQIKTGVTVRKQLSWVLSSVALTFDLWPWSFAWTSLLSLIITPEISMMIRWREHSDKGVTGRQTDRQTDRRTNRRMDWTIHRAAWSQLKLLCFLKLVSVIWSEAERNIMTCLCLPKFRITIQCGMTSVVWITIQCGMTSALHAHRVMYHPWFDENIRCGDKPVISSHQSSAYVILSLSLNEVPSKFIAGTMLTPCDFTNLSPAEPRRFQDRYSNNQTPSRCIHCNHPHTLRVHNTKICQIVKFSAVFGLHMDSYLSLLFGNLTDKTPVSFCGNWKS